MPPCLANISLDLHSNLMAQGGKAETSLYYILSIPKLLRPLLGTEVGGSQ